MKQSGWIIGIDEVGRGSIAGPVTVAALALPQESRIKNQESRAKLRDSKKLSSKQREQWFAYTKNHPKIFYAVAHVQPSVVDRINITQAANRAATKALGKLLKNNELRIKNNARIYLDGGLYLVPELVEGLHYRNPSTPLRFAQGVNAKTVIRGDEKIKAVMLASIVAKVTRDRLMRRLHKKHPKYGFDAHKGYGTRAHMAAVKRLGPSPKHRLTFLIKTAMM